MQQIDPALWENITAYLRTKHATICRQWFDSLEALELDAGILTVLTPNVIQRNYLQRRCSDQFNEAAQAVTGALIAVRFVCTQVDTVHLAATKKASPTTSSTMATISDSNAAPIPTDPLENGPPSQALYHRSSADTSDDSDESIISPDYSFDSFVTGASNELAYAAAIAVTNEPGKAYNPLFIYGGVGLGKTHLLQAICQTLIQANPTFHVCYLSCEVFMNHFLDCVQKGRMSQFRQRYRQVDVLVIDDVQFLANRERTQEEFFHTFNALYQSNRQIVLSSDRPPQEIPQLEERLVSRFGWGLVSDVSRPDYETRVGIVRAKAKLRDLVLPDDVVQYIAAKIESNARELEGAVTTMQGYTALRGQSPNLEMAREALGDYHAGAAGSQVTLQQIIEVVTNFYNVKLSDLQSKRRHRSITGPRQICMWLARQKTRFSLEEIGGYFGGRDHTTVMHSIKVVDDRQQQDHDFAYQLQQLAERVTRPRRSPQAHN